VQLGRVLSTIGDHTCGYVALSRSWHIGAKQKNRRWEAAVAAYLAELLLWLGYTAKAGAWAEKAWEGAADLKFEQDFIRAALMQGRVAVGLCDLARADERLHHALTRARAVNAVEFELPALIAIAELELLRGSPAEARALLDDVWEVAERGPYPLRQADAYNVLAAISLAESDKPAALIAAAKAYKVAWCDGPPYTYHWGLQKAKVHLATLGAGEPDMTSFDESKFAPLPQVEINPKDEYWVDPAALD